MRKGQVLNSDLFLMEEGFRWFGPGDPVPLAHIRQTGATSVFTSLHQIPYGEVWPVEAIRERQELLRAAALEWRVAESVPVHEDIKVGRGNVKELIANYAQTLRNLATRDVRVVVYNFMPVLDWIRTDTRYTLPDGATCLRYDPARFAAFEMYALKRPGAEADYIPEQIARANAWWSNLPESERATFIQSIIDVFPGCKLGLSLNDIRAMLARYDKISDDRLLTNLTRFLLALVPVAEEVGIRLAIHPDDPPFPVLGLPRIVSTAGQVQKVLSAVDSPANGLCFCTGSFSARPENDLPAMVKQFAPRINAVHLRSTQRLADGSFFEADHLGGSAPMPALVQLLLQEQDRRRQEDRRDWQLCFRPDHGHVMMDDLDKPDPPTVGYSGIGRMRGLAELRGLMTGLRYSNHTAEQPSPGTQTSEL